MRATNSVSSPALFEVVLRRVAGTNHPSPRLEQSLLLSAKNTWDLERAMDVVSRRLGAYDCPERLRLLEAMTVKHRLFAAIEQLTGTEPKRPSPKEQRKGSGNDDADGSDSSDSSADRDDADDQQADAVKLLRRTVSLLS